MYLENIKLSEICQTKKANIVQFHLHEPSKGVELIGAEGRIVVPRGWGGEGHVGSLIGTELQFCKMENFCSSAARQY